MTPAENQSVRFNRSVDCNIDETEYRLPVIYGDVTQFQFALDNCLSDPNLIYNGDFTKAGGSGQGWNIVAPSSWLLQPYFGNILHIPNTATGYVGQSVVVSANTLVNIQVEINQTVGQCGLALLSGGVIVWSRTFEGVRSGVFNDYAFSSSEIDTIYLTAGATSNATFGSVRMNAINTRIDAALIDDSDGSVAYGSIPFNVYNGFATFTIDWETLEIPKGCYHVKVYDPCRCGQNGLIGLDLNTGAGGSAVYNYGVGYWVVDSSWVVQNGTALYNGTGVPDTSSIFYTNRPLCVGVEYNVRYTVSALANAQVRIGLGSTFGTWQTADGTYTETITASVSGTIQIVAQSIGVAGVVAISNFQIEAVDPVADYESVGFSVTTVEEDCCTKLVTICNDSDAFDMGFVGTGFAPNVRLNAHLRGTNYTSDRNRYIDSVGRSTVYYGRSRKVRELAFEAPEFVHDFIRLGVIADHVFVDGDEYVVEADEYPTMSLNDWDDMSGVQLPLSAKVENNMNRRLSDVVRGCGADGQPLGTQDKPTIIGGTTPPRKPLATTDGEIITVDG